MLLQEAGVRYTFDYKEGLENRCFGFAYSRHNVQMRNTSAEMIYIDAEDHYRAKNYLMALVNHWNKQSWDWKFTV